MLSLIPQQSGERDPHDSFPLKPRPCKLLAALTHSLLCGRLLKPAFPKNRVGCDWNGHWLIFTRSLLLTPGGGRGCRALSPQPVTGFRPIQGGPSPHGRLAGEGAGRPRSLRGP